jgi:hypothetical protein
VNRTCLVLLASLALTPLAARADVISVAPRDVQGLVAAIDWANRHAGPDTIELGAGSLYAITSDNAFDPELALPLVKSDIRILGNKAEVRRYSNDSMLLLEVAEGGSLRLENLTLAEGSRGAMVNRGTLSMSHVNVRDNTAHGDQAIVANYGQMRGDHVDISDNEIAGAQRDAGIVLNFGHLKLTDSRLSENTVSRRFNSLVSASGVLNFGVAQLLRVRVVNNDADDETATGLASTLMSAGNGRFETTALTLTGNQPEAANQITAARRP